MKNVNQMTMIGILVIIGILIVVGIAVMNILSSRSDSQPLRARIIAQSKKYVERLGTKPFETLTITQKLLVLHAYSNLGKYTTVIQHAESMIDEFRQLSPERKIAFGEIVEESYRHLGKEQDAVVFRRQVGL